MNAMYELERYSFVWKRDGPAAAQAFARQCIKVYTVNARDRRLEHKRRDVYYQRYVESAWSFRCLLRHVHISS